MRTNLTPNHIYNRRNFITQNDNISNINNNVNTSSHKNFDNNIDFAKFIVKQNGRNYILSIQIKEENIELKCIEETSTAFPPLEYKNEFSFLGIRQKVNNTIDTIQDAFKLIDATILREN